MQTNRFLTALLAVAFLLGYSTSYSQNFDYEKYPVLDVQFSTLDLDLNIDPEELIIKGTASYRLQTRIAGVDTLVLHAAHMEIARTSVNGEDASFTLRNDSLFIPLSDSSDYNESYEVTIAYSTAPAFGILQNENGTLWTSHLPQTTRHWLPVVDHPRVTVKSMMTLRVPSGMKVIATGTQTKEKIVNVDSEAYTFQSKGKVPVTDLSFAVGNFEDNRAVPSVGKISLRSERGILGKDHQNKLLQKANDLLTGLEEYLNKKYPFGRLNIIVLEDHSWETKTWGASTIFLYKNFGSLEAQLMRGLYGQWFGTFQRAEQWDDAEGMVLLQTALQNQVGHEPQVLKIENYPAISDSNLYNIFSPTLWNHWQENFGNIPDYNWSYIVSNSVKPIIQWGEGVYSFSDYAEYWYEQSGQPYFEMPKISKEGKQVASGDSVLYRVEYQLQEAEGKLKLTFEAEQGMYEELISLPVKIISSGGTDTASVTFTGRADSVLVNVPTLVENVYLDASGREKLRLDEYKPASFLIYEIRNSTDSAKRIEAAEKLGYHTDNPDLQLAIKDMLGPELEPGVRAALLSSLSKITRGASGLEQVFLDALKSENASIQHAALTALQNYRGNENVRRSVRDFAIETDSLSLFKNAAQIFSSVADTSSYKKFVNTIVESDTAGHRAIFAVQQLANMGVTGQAVKQAKFYISDVYNFGVRKKALGILVQYDQTPSDWEARTEQLLDDSDPRIRYLTVGGLTNISGLDYTGLLKNYLLDEYDARVHEKILQLLDRDL